MTAASAARAVRRAVGLADGALVDVRNRLTPGQRWTAALVMALTVLVLLFGIPRSGSLTTPGAPAAPGAPASTTTNSRLK